MKLSSYMMSAFDFFLQVSILLFCINFQVGLGTSGVLGNETDRLSLLAFKVRISPDPFQVMRSWNDSIHFCEWQGVTCSRRHQRVTMLNLMSQGLGGSISPHIGNLSFLRVINLENNSFQGEIPQEVGRLFRLQEFNMSANSFVGEIPDNITHCSNLKILRLGHNNLTGGIPQSLGNLSSLNVLSLEYNSLERNIPDSLGKLKSLKRISLAANMLSGMIPSSLYNLSSSEFFSLAANRLVGSLPNNIGFTLAKLSEIYIGGNQFFGSIPVSLFNVSRLKKIDLSFCNFTGDVPINVGNLKGLQYLNLASNNLGSGTVGDLNFFNSLTNCTYLSMLGIDGNHFGGKLPNSISNLSIQLSELHVGRNQISGNIPVGIENLVNLFALSMESNLFTGPIPKGIGMLQKLQELILDANLFSGTIPSSLGNLSQLYLLQLSNNILEGNIISDLAKCHSLQILGLARNNLNGTIPKHVIISLSSQLIYINLAYNSLIGSLPVEVGKLNSLQRLRVAENKLSGQIPSSLGSCSSLEYLSLEGNFFQGTIPSSFSSLKGLQYLDLSRNNISGEIPKVLQDPLFLEYLNISFNELEGEVPVKGVFKNTSGFTFVGNSKLCGGIPELQLAACPIKKYKQRGKSLAFKVSIGVILFLIVVASFLVFYLRKKPRMKSSSTIFLSDWYKRVSYNGLHRATNGFASANLIGVGSFGSVYKGILHQDEIPIAVKVLNLNVRGASKSFMTECKALRKIRHRNLLKIITACSSVDFRGNDFKALVFEYMPNGSLENWLHPSSDEINQSCNLNLRQRLSIAIDIASALDYLHNHCPTPIIHCDLKPSNVLLDDDMTAHVGDFGLAKILASNTNNSSEIDTNSIFIKGSIGYIPPEYSMGVEVSTQGDVYSYGILLLELLTGKRPTDEIFKDGLSLHQFSQRALTDQVMEIVDPCLRLEDHSEAIDDFQNQRYNAMDEIREYLISMFRIGVVCSTESLGDRMEIKDVLLELHSIEKMFLKDGIH